MTAPQDQENDKTLAYQTPPRGEEQAPIPAWKHAVFGPLLVWVGLFILGMTVLVVMAGVGIVRLWLSP
jgi:hypothetical protein